MEPNFQSARAWELANGAQLIDGMWSHGALRMVEDVCNAVKQTVGRLAVSSRDARNVLEQYPAVLSRCDELSFEEPGQALAYLVMHLPDRYCRVFLALGELLKRGMLPLGRTRFAAVDIGAGPGPGIFAVRNFYAALSSRARQDHQVDLRTLGATAVVERSGGMSWVMHHFAETLLTVEGTSSAVDNPASNLHPFAAELAASGMPFRASHLDFTTLDLRADHIAARRRLARELEDELEIGSAFANKWAHEEPIAEPSGYSIALMTNFLTTTDAVPAFRQALRRLASGALVPGGVLIVLGAVSGEYQQIYSQLDKIALSAGLTIMDGFEEPFRVGSRADELAVLAETAREMWRSLTRVSGPVSQVEAQLKEMRAADIFDEARPYRLPAFRIRVYRRGRWPELK